MDHSGLFHPYYHRKNSADVLKSAHAKAPLPLGKKKKKKKEKVIFCVHRQMILNLAINMELFPWVQFVK